MAAIYFDVDGTLLEYDRPFEAVFEDAFGRAGVTPPPGAYETYSEAFFDAFEALSEDPYRDGFREVVTEYDLDARARDLRDALIDAELAAVSPPPGARDALAALREEHDLGVLSNGIGDVQRAKLERHGLDDLFEVVLVSHELGVLKPDPEIFTIARRRLDADRYVYVCDDAEADVLPANELGFLTVQVVEEDGSDSPADAWIRRDEFDRIADVI